MYRIKNFFLLICILSISSIMCSKEAPKLGGIENVNVDFSIPFGKRDIEIGQGILSMQYENARIIHAVPSYGIFDKKIFIIDAINFRILVYDYNGKYIKKINYPMKTDDDQYNIISDIALAKDRIFLVSYYRGIIYMIDYNGKVLGVITGKDTKNKKFYSLSIIGFDYNTNNLIVPDTWDNTLYYYKIVDGEIKLAGISHYEDDGQLYVDAEGKSYVIDVNNEKGVINIFTQKGGETAKKLLTRINNKSYIDHSSMVGIDKSGSIYVFFIENPNGPAQFGGQASLKVYSKTGNLIKTYPIDEEYKPTYRFINVDKEDGKIFIAYIDVVYAGTEDPYEEPSPKCLRIKSIN